MADAAVPCVVRVIIHGRVQAVWCRAWTVETAMRHALTGWVRHRRDGTVEALFAGPPEVVEAMIAECWGGRPTA